MVTHQGSGHIPPGTPREKKEVELACGVSSESLVSIISLPLTQTVFPAQPGTRHMQVHKQEVHCIRERRHVPFSLEATFILSLEWGTISRRQSSPFTLCIELKAFRFGGKGLYLRSRSANP